MNQSEMLASYRGDPMLMGIGASLLCIGLVAIASASIEYGDFHFGNPWHHTTRHALYLALGVAAGAITYMTPTQTLETVFTMATLPRIRSPDTGFDAGYRPRGEWRAAMVAVGSVNFSAV
jgi:cell division protein FtsW (lipid II flippase)